MKMKVPKKMSLKKFVDWMKEHTSCEVQISAGRANIIVFADNIEPGRIIPLYAEIKGSRLMVYELNADYISADEAWEALDSGNADISHPLPFHEWVKEQYLTAGKVEVTNFVL
jgi:hypothetical protein